MQFVIRINVYQRDTFVDDILFRHSK